MPDTDTIVAVATPPGSGGVGIVRLSGPRAQAIAHGLCGRVPPPRQAAYVRFNAADGDTIDDGLVLLFAAPASFTGEDVVELQAHGSPAVLQQLVARCCALGARMARAGEFSERAFLNGKLDLAQAEAVADLIAASDERAARAARRALEGEFSRRVDALAEQLVALRVHAEAAIDFVDEPLETLGGAQLRAGLDDAAADLEALLAAAERGRKLRDGLHAVIVGPPNAGKSSLLNALAGQERAIVTEVAGTTRDLLRETVRVEGMELTLVDTAGLREGGDAIEREGMRRAQEELQRADMALVVLDVRAPTAGWEAIAAAVEGVPQQIVVHNKCDLQAADAPPAADVIRVSARTGEGLEVLQQRLRATGLGPTEAGEGTFTARARQVEALRRAAMAVAEAQAALATETLDLAAESLRLAHDTLGEITGRMHADVLLGRIFSTFCIGK